MVNGQKTWTTLGHYADWIFCLVRTDPDVKNQEGISFLLIDMKTPGVTVRPIVTLAGDHVVNEVFLEDVRVPAGNLVGELNRGWDYAKFLLSNERTGIAGIGASKADLEHLKDMARLERKNGKPLIDDPLLNWIFTLSFNGCTVQIKPSSENVGTPSGLEGLRHFRSSTTPGAASLISALMSAIRRSRQSSSTAHTLPEAPEKHHADGVRDRPTR